MVSGSRRFRKYYSLNSRHNGVTMSDIRRGRKMERAFIVLMARYAQQPTVPLTNVIVVFLLVIRNIFGDRACANPVFVRIPRLLINYCFWKTECPHGYYKNGLSCDCCGFTEVRN